MHSNSHKWQLNTTPISPTVSVALVLGMGRWNLSSGSHKAAIKVLAGAAISSKVLGGILGSTMKFGFLLLED